MYEVALSALRSLADTDIGQVESKMLTYEQAPCSVAHHFGPGQCIRELSMPAGTMAIGHAQKYEQMNVVVKGRVAMLNEDGTTFEVVAPAIFVGKPGRKIGLVLEDVVWLNIFATDLTSAEEVEEYFFDKSAGWQADFERRSSIRNPEFENDRADFAAMLQEYGLDETVVRQQSENPHDQIPMPMGSWNFIKTISGIEGCGITATQDILIGSLIGPARVRGKRTPLGRYVNHSANPNSVMVKLASDDIILMSTAPIIKGCRGGQPGEEITIDYRQALALSGVYPKEKS